MLGWIIALAFALLLWDFHGILAAFFWGGFTHVLADSMKVSGVPLSPILIVGFIHLVAFYAQVKSENTVLDGD